MKYWYFFIFLFFYSLVLNGQNVQLNTNIDAEGGKLVPRAAFDIVSTTSGFLAPRMTSQQLLNFLSTLNTNEDISGGTDGPSYSKAGMTIECIDCIPLDGSTFGVSVKIYPNFEKTFWIAKKMW
jgi:hypothetical protein